MNDFDWMEEIPNPHELTEEYRLLKVDAINKQNYIDAAKYRDLEREVLELPKFDEFSAWKEWFESAKISGELHSMLINLGRVV